MYSNTQHSIYDEMRYVHDLMLQKYKLQQEAAVDIQRAKTMELYLRAFKTLGNQKKQNNNVIMQNLETQAMQDIVKQVGQKLGIGRYNLFQNQHSWYLNSQQRWGVDDVFEAELQTFLNTAIEEATNGAVKGDAKTIGNLPGNISEKLMKTLNQNQNKLIDNLSSDLVNTPIFKSGKVDVKSFTTTVTADIKPFWQDFINAFTGAKFTVKNYKGNSSTETIHLGKTNIMKSLMGSLSELVHNEKEAIHIYYHSLYYADVQKDQEIGQHILHLRFSYELSGEGLYDEQHNKIDEADFFIYNDSTSNNIYVRSTKEMIANALDYMGQVSDPIRSSVVILKNSFH